MASPVETDKACSTTNLGVAGSDDTTGLPYEEHREASCSHSCSCSSCSSTATCTGGGENSPMTATTMPGASSPGASSPSACRTFHLDKANVDLKDKPAVADSIPAEVYKEGGEALTVKLHDLFALNYPT